MLCFLLFSIIGCVSFIAAQTFFELPMIVSGGVDGLCTLDFLGRVPPCVICFFVDQTWDCEIASLHGGVWVAL